MTSFSTILNTHRRTSVISRDGVEPFGARHVSNDATILGVRAFRFADIPGVVAGGQLIVAGAYLLADQERDPAAYVGESGNVGRRLQEHFGDRDKAFATEVFVVSSRIGELPKQGAIHLQKRLSELVKAAGVARLIAGVGPCAAYLARGQTDSLDLMLADALPLLFDAGCRFLAPALRGKAAVTAKEDAVPPNGAANDDVGDDGDEGEPMEIGVTTVPLGVEEQELSYADLWARGYQHQARFVVAAGSEMRAAANASAITPTVTRRQRLINSGAAVEITGVEGKLRLQVAVAFPSRAIAAKVLTGAHVGSDKWRPLQAAARCVYAA